jgi:hypothetical protein
MTKPDFITGLTGFSLVGLKLTGYIGWSWWLVTLPFWISFVLFLATITVGGIIAAGAVLFDR